MSVLGNLRTEHEAWQCRADDEHRHQQERLVLIAGVREWAVARRRSPDGETCEQECDGSRIARPLRSPAQSKGAIARKLIEAFPETTDSGGQKTTKPTALATIARSIVLSRSLRCVGQLPCFAQSTMTGVNRMALAKSPIHQVIQTEEN